MEKQNWLVKKPGEHGKGYRVVESCGITIKGQEIFAAICEISTARTSADNFSDAKEAERAAFIVTACNAYHDLIKACEYAKMHLGPDSFNPVEGSYRKAMDKLSAAIAKARGAK